MKQEWWSVHATCMSFHIFIHNLRSFRRIGRISHTVFSLYPVNIVEFKLKCISDATQYSLGSGFPSGHLWSLNEQLKNKVCLENEVATNKGITKLTPCFFCPTDISCKHRRWSSLTSETSHDLWSLNQWNPPLWNGNQASSWSLFLPPIWKNIKISLRGSSLYT